MRSNQLPVYAIRLWFPDMFGNFNIVKYHKFTCNPLFTRTAKIRLDCTKSDGKIEIFLSFLDGQKNRTDFGCSCATTEAKCKNTDLCL